MTQSPGAGQGQLPVWNRYLFDLIERFDRVF